MMKVPAMLFLFVFLPALYVSGENVDLELSSDTGFEFLGKFCYDRADSETVGTMEITVHDNGGASKDLDVLMFSDEDGRWPMVYDGSYKDLTCEQMREYANNWIEGNVPSEYKIQFADGSTTFRTPKIQIVQKVRPRFWYVVLANCDPDGFKDIHVEGEFLNTINGGFQEQFGVDYKGLNLLYIFFFLFYCVLVVLQAFSVKSHWTNQKYVHPMLRIFSFLVVIEFFSILFYLCHYLKYTGDGVGLAALAKGAEALDVVSQVLFMMQLMLLAKGWTISTEELTGKKLVLGTGGVFLGLRFLMLLWKWGIEDPQATRPPIFYSFCEVIFAGLWIAFASYFLKNVYSSWKSEDNESKSGLYIKLGLSYGIWFFGIPFVSLLVLVLDPWVRIKTVSGFSVALTLAAYSIMVFLFWPSRAADYFAITTPSTTTMEHYNQL